jgi:hypothetical protein
VSSSLTLRPTRNSSSAFRPPTLKAPPETAPPASTSAIFGFLGRRPSRAGSGSGHRQPRGRDPGPSVAALHSGEIGPRTGTRAAPDPGNAQTCDCAGLYAARHFVNRAAALSARKSRGRFWTKAQCSSRPVGRRRGRRRIRYRRLASQGQAGGRPVPEKSRDETQPRSKCRKRAARRGAVSRARLRHVDHSCAGARLGSSPERERERRARPGRGCRHDRRAEEAAQGGGPEAAAERNQWRRADSSR